MSGKLLRRCVTAALTTTVLLAGGAVQTASASPVAKARHLATRVAKAKTDAARVKALDAVFRALHLGVRTPTLRRVVPGGKSAGDIYLYTDEVSELANAVGRDSRTSFDELARTLTSDGYVAKPPAFLGFPPTAFTGHEIQAKVEKAEKHWEHRGGRPALYGDVIRALGVRRHSDLARPVKANAEVVDPVQEVLISLGLLAQAKVEHSAFAASPMDTRQHGGLEYAPRVRAADETPCGWSGGLGGPSISATAGNWAENVGKGAIMSGFGPLVDLFHGIVLGIDIEVIRKSPDLLSGEFGQHGPHSATPMTFRVLVFNHGYPSDRLIKCGAFQGRHFPKHGPVPGIPVNWETTGAKIIGSSIDNYSQLNSGPSTVTDANGLAKFTVIPDTEYVPDAGPVRSTTGHVLAAADTLSTTGNGFAGPLAGITKDRPLAWGVSWHQAHGYLIDVPDFTVKETFQKGTQSQSTETWHLKLHNMSICLGPGSVESHPLEPQTDYVGFGPAFGGNPLHGKPDSGYVTGTGFYQGPDSSGTTNVNSADISMPFNGRTPIGMSLGLGSDLASARIDTPFTWQGGHAAAKITLSFDSSTWPDGYTVSPASFNWTVPLQDDDRCPLPKPGS